MEAAFGWIGELISWLIEFLPHLGILRKKHGGVKFKRGKIVREIKPGLYWWWPFVTETETTTCARQTLSLEAQRLTTKDGYTVSVRLVVAYWVEDVVKALVDTDDYDDAAEDLALDAVVEIISTNDWKWIHENLSGEVRNAVTRKCRGELKKMGLYVEKARIVDFTETVVYTMVGGGITMPVGEITDE